MGDLTKTKGGFHADTATERARTIGLPKVEKRLEQLAKYAQRPNRSRTEGGTTGSGAPMRSIRENLVNRGPGTRAATNYLSGQPAAKLPAIRNERSSSGSRRAGDAVNIVNPQRKISFLDVNAPKRMRSGPNSFSKDDTQRIAHVAERARFRTAEDISYAKTGGSLNYENDWVKPPKKRVTQANPVGRLAAAKYLNRPKAEVGLLKTIAKTAGRVGARIIGIKVN